MRSDLPEDAKPSDAPSATELGEGEQGYAQAHGAARPAPRPDASMTLLTSMLERPLDPGYPGRRRGPHGAGQAAQHRHREAAAARVAAPDRADDRCVHGPAARS
uniref:Uncharacterized protein n=1 Tax=Janibacter limosus TaxID=53458 RepID=A0AC61U850_9MICO|nr:hypothetical protein [Janibacter limosus]